MLDVHHIGGRAQDSDLSFSFPPGRVTAADDEGCNLRDTWAALNGHRIVKRQVSGGSPDKRPRAAGTGCLRLAWKDHQQMGAQRGELASHVAACAFTNSRQQHDGSDTDRDR
jgi:hypothetical protein